jgi:hypothetical protein
MALSRMRAGIHSIPPGIATIRRLGREQRFAVEQTGDERALTDHNLATLDERAYDLPGACLRGPRPSPCRDGGAVGAADVRLRRCRRSIMVRPHLQLRRRRLASSCASSPKASSRA